MSGFRVAKGGAQEIYSITPDLTTLGKILGGGLPVGAYGGRREIMQMVAPSGPIYQAGTLSGNPLAMTAGLETLKIIDEDEGFYHRLEAIGADLEQGIRNALGEFGLNYTLNRVGSMFTLFFTESAVKDFDSAKTSDTEKFAAYFGAMLDAGVFAPDGCSIGRTGDSGENCAKLRGCPDLGLPPPAGLRDVPLWRIFGLTRAPTNCAEAASASRFRNNLL